MRTLLKESRKYRTLLMAAALSLVAVMLLSSVGWAKDRDGSRMRGKNIEIGKTLKDKLDGDKDKADWRYIELQKGCKLKIVVTVDPASAGVTVRVTDAKGKTLKASSSGKAKRSLETMVDPGIYYIEVTSDSKINYSIVVSTE